MKRIYKISINLLMFGWCPLFLVAAISKNIPDNINTSILLIGVVLCMFGALLSMALATNKHFWKSLEELEELKQEYRKSIAEYNKVKNKLINKIIEQEE